MKPDAPLDMRMDRTAAFSAEDLLNEYSKSEIEKILKVYGERKICFDHSVQYSKSAREKAP